MGIVAPAPWMKGTGAFSNGARTGVKPGEIVFRLAGPAAKLRSRVQRKELASLNPLQHVRTARSCGVIGDAKRINAICPDQGCAEEFLAGGFRSAATFAI